MVYVMPQAGGCQIYSCGGKTRRFPCQARDRSAGAPTPFNVLPIGAVCYIPRLRPRRDNVTNGPKALPGGPGAVPPRRSKRVPTVVPR